MKKYEKMNNVFKSAVLKNILNQEFRGAKDVGLWLQNTKSSGNPAPGYACIQGSVIVHALRELNRLP